MSSFHKTVFQYHGFQKKVKSFFPLKNKSIYPACKIHHGLCSCNANYIGKSKSNMPTRWGEPNSPALDSESLQDSNKTYNIVTNGRCCQTLLSIQTRKNPATIRITLLRHSLNDQLNSNKLFYHRNGITWHLIKKVSIYSNA